MHHSIEDDTLFPCNVLSLFVFHFSNPLTVAERHAKLFKLCMDASGLVRKGKFAGTGFFYGRLEDQVALPPIH